MNPFTSVSSCSQWLQRNIQTNDPQSKGFRASTQLYVLCFTHRLLRLFSHFILLPSYFNDHKDRRRRAIRRRQG
jgi:hypothetical protein